MEMSTIGASRFTKISVDITEMCPVLVLLRSGFTEFSYKPYNNARI